MLFEVEAILFDIDGTLVDSTPVVERIWTTWAGSRGLDAAEILRVCHGRRTQDTVAEFLPVGEWDEAVAELEQLERDESSQATALPGTKAILSALQRDRWAAVTSGSDVVMRARLVAAGLPVPDVLIASADVEHGKPDPEGYNKAAAALGRDVRRCLVVEDAPAGVAAGRAAGARVLAVTTSHDAQALGTADCVIADLSACVVEPTSEGLLVVAGP